ncbi:MAG: sensor domain-containing diguanylate cyclase [Pyrinomonadaceae bacterium]
MKNSKNEYLKTNYSGTFGFGQLVLAFLSICALIATFFVSVSSLDFSTKEIIFSVVVVLYLAFYLAFITWQKRRTFHSNENDYENAVGDEVESKLLALEEANQFFGASLKSADMFRFVASRINEMIQFSTCVLFLLNEEKTKLKATFAAGENQREFSGWEIETSAGLAGKVLQSGKPQIDDKLSLEKNEISVTDWRNLNSAIAIPLDRNGEAFGVLTLYGGDKNAFDDKSLRLFEAIGERVAPLFLNSHAFEKSLNNALTDSLTNLPNERAFYLVLENQIAESMRFRDERPLTILTIDIKNFDELNRQFGHSAGDGILKFAADTIKNQLRQMDFLARAANDEFLAVLPTASDEIASEIVERVEKAFVSNSYKVADGEKINLKLNFGAATFGKDGEVASQILKHAHLRKIQSKTNEAENILWFPKEFIN